MSASSTCTAERTTRASASANAAGKPSGSLSCVSTSHPGSLANTASVAGETFSAKTIFIASPLAAAADPDSYSSKRTPCFSHSRSNMRTTAACGLPSPRSYLVIELGWTPSCSAIWYEYRSSCFRAINSFSPNVSSAIPLYPSANLGAPSMTQQPGSPATGLRRWGGNCIASWVGEHQPIPSLLLRRPSAPPPLPAHTSLAA